MTQSAPPAEVEALFWSAVKEGWARSLCDGGGRLPGRQEPAAPIAPWPDVVVEMAWALAKARALLGLAAVGLDALGVLPGDVNLAEHRRRSAAWSMLLHEVRKRIERALAEEGIAPVFLKGVVADAVFFGGSGLRGATDVDVLVPAARLAAAERALTAVGAKSFVAADRAVTERYKPERLFSLTVMGQSVDVDLHVGVTKSPPYIDGAPAMAARAHVYRTPVGDIRGLSPDDMLLHAALNQAGQKFIGMHKLVVDVASLLARRMVDVPAVIRAARRHRVGFALYGLLLLAKERLGAAVPRDWLEACEPRRRLRPVVHALIGRNGGQWLPESPAARLLFVEAPLAGQPLWPLRAALRATVHRIGDRVAARWTGAA